MGRMKDMMDDGGDTCSECGAPLEENEDGELECTNSVPCLAQVMASEERAERAIARRSKGVNDEDES